MSADDGQREPEVEESHVGVDRFDGGDLCPACLAELTAGCGFCPKCGAPVTPTVAMAPFERIFSEGYIYRQAVSAPTKLIVVVGAWFVFLPMLLAGVACIAMSLRTAKPDWYLLSLGIFTGVIGGMGLYHVTRNYVRRPVSIVEPESGSAEE